MNTSLAIAADLARMIFLLRDRPDAKEEQKAAFRLLVSSLGPTDLILQVGPKGLMINQTAIPAQIPEVQELQELLRGHGIGEIRVPAGLMTSTLLSLLRALAAEIGTYSTFDHLVAHLDSVGAGVVQIFPPASVSLAGIVPAETPPPAPPSATSTSSPPVPPRSPSVPPSITEPRPVVGRVSKPDDGTLGDIGPDAMSEAKVGMMHFVTLEMKAVGRVTELVYDLERETSAIKITNLLNELIAACDVAAQQANWPEVLKAASALVRLETRGGEAVEHRAYGIALRRMLPRSHLEHIARLATSGPHKVDAITVLRRMGADATEILLGLLIAAPTVGERRAYFSALTQMTEGASLMVHMLGHDEWFVVRNVAELCGELGLQEAVPELARQVRHSDERVRRAVAGALGKIGGTGTIEPLRHALKDPAPAVRLQAAMCIDGKRERALAMALAAASEEEEKPDVQREMYLAMGRIGSHEAVQALVKAAEPGGRFFKRKSSAARVAAVEGLGLVGNGAVPALKSLLKDDEREVRAAAEKGLEAILRREGSTP